MHLLLTDRLVSMCGGETLMSGVQHKEGLTLNCVSVHVVEHVSKTEYPGSSGR